MRRDVHSVDDLFRLLDDIFKPADQPSDGHDGGTAAGSWWDEFYADRDRDIPFFRPAPDESLVDWHRRGLLPPADGARAIDIGCGPGRNAIWLAEQGYQVDAVDLSSAAVEWGRERATAAGVQVDFATVDIFDWEPRRRYQLVYDSGCFHHLAPHRRIGYRRLLEQTIEPDGFFGLACFAAGAMGSELSDRELYRQGRLFGGLAYTDGELRRSFDWLRTVELRRMQQHEDPSPMFGQSFLWAGLFHRGTAA